MIFYEISISDMESLFISQFFTEKEIKISFGNYIIKKDSELLVIYMRKVFKNFMFFLTEEQSDYITEGSRVVQEK